MRFLNFSLYLTKLLRCRSHGSLGSRKFSSQNFDLKEVVTSELVQKYFKHIQARGVDHSYSSEIKFRIDQLLKERGDALENVNSLLDLEKSSNGERDMLDMLKEEKAELASHISEIEMDLLDALAPQQPYTNEIILEINAGVGGQEAMLFARELKDMYINYLNFKNWNMSYNDSDFTDMNGLRHCTMFFEGRDVYKLMRLESGIHRVQRIPTTERHGRVHTSTVAVAVFPRPREVDIRISEKDLVYETMRSSGAGGQHVNKTESAVRLTHVPSGIVIDSRTDRSQIRNREIARSKLLAKLWDLETREINSSHAKSRKDQIGTSARSDKIRTYNYPQDRITDHRIPLTLHNVPLFLQGEDHLDSLMSQLVSLSERERFDSFISKLKDELVSVSL